MLEPLDKGRQEGNYRGDKENFERLPENAAQTRVSRDTRDIVSISASMLSGDSGRKR